MPRAATGTSTSPPPGHGSEEDLYEEVDGVRLSKIACRDCQKRKIKCSRGVPACSFCSGVGQACVYARVVRTPLTRKNLDEEQKKNGQLVTLVQALGMTEEELKAYLESGQLPRRSPTPRSLPLPPREKEESPVPASLPSSKPTLAAATMPPPPPTPQTSAVLPPSQYTQHQPPVFPSPHLYSPHSQGSPLLAGSSSSPAQHTLTLPTSMPSLHYGTPSLSQPTPYPPRPSLPSMSTSFTAPASLDATQASAMLPPPLPQQHSTPVDADEGDGMGSLTVESNGGPSGYLGSLSGAALLRFLQTCATDVNLSVKGSGKSAASPSSTIGSAALNPEQFGRFIDAYFSVFHLQYNIIHEASFRAQLADIIPRPGGAAWGLLHAAVLGLGSMCVVGESEGTEAVALYERAATAVNSAMFESASLTSVQAFVLLGNLAQKLNFPSPGAIYLGIALRMAINLGLHSEASGKNLSPFEQEMRRRVWWTLYVFDSGAQLTFGHPSTLPSTGVDVWTMLNVPDSTFTPTAVSRPFSSDFATACSSLMYQTVFHSIANRAITFIVGQNGVCSAQEALNLQADLISLQTSLPAYFFSPLPTWFEWSRAKMQWRIENLRMIILRSTFLKVSSNTGDMVTDEEETAWSKCLESALSVISSVDSFTSSRPRSAMELWYALHFLFPAVFIPLIALRVRPSSPATIDWVVSIQSAKNILERVPYTLLKGLASRGLAILNAVATLDTRGDGTTTAAPIDIDFSAFLEMLGGPSEYDGAMPGAGSSALPVPNALSELDFPTTQLFNWFSASGPPSPSAYHG